MKSVLSVAIVAIGVLFRLYLYFRNPSFYTDEILLALNVVQRDFAGLLTPLDRPLQVAPVLFLWMQKLSIGIFGPGEASFRLPTLLFGIALLPLVYRCALRFTGRESAALCTALAAFSPALLRYSTEAKQYGIEPAISAALLLLAAPLLSVDVAPRRRYFLIAGGVLALTLSLPSIFVLGGVWMALALAATQKHRWKQDFLWLAAAGGLWVALFAVIYFKLYAYAANSPYMIEFWTPGYLTSQGSLYGGLLAAVKGFLDPVFALEGKLPAALLLAAGLLLVLGIYTIWKQHGSPVTVMLIAPLGAVLGTAVIGKWVFTTRLMLFTVPLTILLLSAGAGALCARFQAKWQRTALAVLTLALVAAPLKYDAWILRHPTLGGVRAAVRLGLNRSHSGDEIYVYAGASPGWTFYSVNWSAPEQARVTRLLDAMIQIGPNPGNAPSRGRPVQHEAFDLQGDLDGKREVWGIASGVQTTIHGSGPGEPDAGWVDNEVSRIRQSRSSTVFVVVSEYRAQVVEPLLTGLSAAGGMVTSEFHDSGSALYQVKFPSRN